MGNIPRVRTAHLLSSPKQRPSKHSRTRRRNHRYRTLKRRHTPYRTHRVPPTPKSLPPHKY